MDDDSKFWLRIWQTITAGIVALAAVIGSCTMHSNYLTTQAIEKGSDPIKVSCALSSGPDRVICTLAATH
jgi:hypothetical protein